MWKWLLQTTDNVTDLILRLALAVVFFPLKRRRPWMRKGLFLLLILAITSYGCATTMGPKETGGTVIGGVGGAIIGSQVGGGAGRLVGVAIGTLAGALIGQEVGRSLDKADRLAAIAGSTRRPS